MEDRTISNHSYYVVGAGAIGRVVYALLQKAGVNPILVCRDETAEDIRNKGGYTLVTNGDEETYVKPFVASFSEVQTQNFSGKSSVFYATKASYLADTVEQISPLASNEDAEHVFLQGGIPWWFGHHMCEPGLSDITDPGNRIKSVIPSLENVYAGMIKFGAALETDSDGDTATLKGQGDFTFGAVHSSTHHKIAAQSLADLFDPKLVKPSTVTQPLYETVWNKAAGSFAMSIMALITDKNLGALYSDEKQNMITAAQTIVSIGEDIGIWANTPTDFDSYFRAIAERKPDHMMSITNDPSEITQIIEWPIAIGKKSYADVSGLEALYQQIPEKYKVQKINSCGPSETALNSHL